MPVPGTLRVWMQAGPDSYAQQTVFPLARPGTLEDINQVGDLRRYPVAGNRAPLDLLHGPVGPGLELGPHARTGAGAERLGDHLHLFVPLLAGAGAPSFAFADRRDADWALHRDAAPSPGGTRSSPATSPVPHGPRTYRLSATTHPGPAWDLSTRVSARWVFHSRAGQGAVPLLTPRYTPPTNLAGSMGPGATGFALTFHSTPHSARVTRATVELSDDDGRSWRRLRVHPMSALTFHVGYRNPSAHGDVRYVSLRLTARDAKHSSVQEPRSTPTGSADRSATSTLPTWSTTQRPW